MKKLIGILLVAILLGSGYWAWSGLQGAQTGATNSAGRQSLALEKSNDANNVTADVTFLTPQGKASDNKLTFRIRLNTHMVPLSSYDIAKSAAVSSPTGIAATGFSWKPESEQSHHRSGLLTVPNNGLWGPNTEWLSLELKNLAGMPSREFRWQGNEMR
ncbi:MAG: hypothetical protein M1609_05545 [Firmicutes bacterium]|nr:hypothetical protein [Bacillota bacterium]